MKKVVLFLFALLLSSMSFADNVTTNSGSGLAPTYPTLYDAITALNNIVTMTGAVEITLTGNETAPVGGYSITQLGGTSSYTILIQGSGSTITAGLQTAASHTDAIFKIIGGDYITIQNFTMQENAGNTVATYASNTMTEFGVALFMATATNGAQNNTIQNNTITLGSTFQDAFGIFSTSSSSSTNGALAATSTAGTNSNNKFYNNIISGVAYGMYFICEPVTATIFESGIDIGGSASGTGNNITFGFATAATLSWTRFSSVLPAGITFRNGGAGNNVSYNTITSNNLAYAQSGGVGGIVTTLGTAALGVTYTSTRNNNTITLYNNGTTAITGIDFGAGLSTGTITASNNTIVLNQGTTAAASAAIIGIKASYASATNTLNTNTITVNQSPTTAGSITSAVTGITGAGIGTTVTANSNIITFKQNAPTGTATYGLGAIRFIDVAAGSGTVNVNSNQLLTTGSTIRSTGTCTAIYHEGTFTVSMTANLNTITIDRIAASGTIYGTYVSGGPSEVADNITNNVITFTNLAGTAVAYPIYCLGGVSATATPKAFNSNTINVSGTNSGIEIGIQTGYSYGTMNNNSVTLSSAGATLVGYQATGTGAGAYTMTGNTLSLTSSTTSPTSMIGFNVGATGPFQLYSNTFSAMNFTGIITGAPVVSAIACAAGTGNNIYSNYIANISVGAATSTATPTVDGILISGGVSTNVYKNKICGITTNATGTTTVVNGIRISGGGTTGNTVYNNLIDGLTAPASASVDALRGISITSTTATSTNNIYYNTVYLNGSSTGANFGTSGIYHAASATATTATLNLRNNIIVNKSTPAGTGLTVVFRRSLGTAGTLANYASTSNNNLFYAGTPAASPLLIYYDGTSTAATMAAYQGGVFTAGTIAPRDAASFSADAPFLSTACGSADFLKIDPAVATQIESGGTPVSGITDDYSGTARNATTPDIGAYEGTYTPLDLTPPNISYVPLPNTILTTERTLAVTITDPSGVGTGANSPVLYWKKTGDAGYTGPVAVTLPQTGNIYNFQLGAGVITGDVVSYFVVAQDNAPATNVGSYPTGATVTANPPLASAGPPSPSTYTIISCVSGEKTVGVSVACDYPTITAALAYLNANQLCGPVTLKLMDASYSASETFPLVINANVGTTSANTITIVPGTGVTATISGTVASGPVIKIFNSYTMIDGSNNGTSSRNLTITNLSGTGPQVVLIGSSGTTPLTNVTVKNSVLINGANTGSAVVVADAAGTAGYFNNITVQNNDIQKAYIGIYSLAAVATGNGSGLLIDGNTMTASGANSIRLVGIYAQGVDGVTVSNNQIGNISDANAESPKAIWFATGTNSGTISGNTITNMTLSNTGSYALSGIYVNPGTTSTSISITNNTVSTLSNSGTLLSYAGILSFSPNTSITNNTISGMTQVGAAAFWGIVQSGAVNSSCSGNTVSGLTTSTTGVTNGINIQGASTGVTISKNLISNIKNTNSGGYTAVGLALASSSNTASISVTNNFIWDVAGYGYGSLTTDNGYGINIYSGGGYNIYFNSVNLATNQTSATGDPACLFISSSVTTAASLDIRDNIFSIPATAGAQRYCVLSGAANTVFSYIDYNDYYTSGPNLGYIGALDMADLAAWKTGTGQDNHSLSGDPMYMTATNLHIQTSVITPVSNSGFYLASVPTDIDGDTRNTGVPLAPDMGADEYLYVAPTVVDPSGCHADAVSSSQINVFFTLNPSSNNVVIIYDNDGTFNTPSGPPPPSGTFAGGTILYNGATSPVNHTGLVANTYHYKLFSYDGTYYSAGVEVSNATLAVADPNPFTATTVSKSQIDLAWTRNAVPNDVMIVTNTTTTFATPVNGATYTIGNPVEGVGTVLYIGSLEAYQHTTLAPLSTHYYKAYSIDLAKNYSAGKSANATTMCDYPTITGTTGGGRCGAGTVTLQATSTGGTITWYDVVTGGLPLPGTGSPWVSPFISATKTFYVDAETSSTGNSTVGNATTQTSSYGYPTAFGNYWYQDWSQMVYTANELHAAGLSGGPISSITFYVGGLPDGTPANYSISLGNIANSVLTGFTTTGLTVCFGPATAPTPVLGANTITFTTPFTWDGTSNLLVDIRGTGAYGSLNATTYFTGTTGNTVVYAYSSSNNTAFFTSNPTATTSTSRLNATFAGTITCAGPRTPVDARVTDAALLTITPDQTICTGSNSSISVIEDHFEVYTWSPVTDLYNNPGCTDPYIALTNKKTVYVKPAAAGMITYTCTASNPATPPYCGNVATTHVTALATPPAPTTTGYSLCLGGTIPAGQGLQSTSLGAPLISGTQTINFNVTAQPVETNAAPGNIVASATMSALPVGATVTSVVITYNGIEAIGNSWMSDVRLGLSGALVNAAAAGDGTIGDAGLFNYTRTATTGISITSSGGTVNLLYWDYVSDNTGDESIFPLGTAVASVVIHYTSPDPGAVAWYRTSTGGTAEGYGSPFNPVGVYPLDANTAGTFAWYAQVMNGTCGSARTSADLVIGSTPSVTASAAPGTTVCAGTLVTLDALPAGGGTPYTYSWKVGGTEVSTSKSFTVTPSTTTTYDLTMTDFCTQIATSSVTITVKPVPTASASSNTPQCSGNTLELYGTPGTGTLYSWTGPNGFNSSTQNPTIPSVTAAATGTYTFISTLDGCASAPATTGVVVNLTPSAITIDPPAPTINQGDIQQLTASGGTLDLNYSNGPLVNSPGTGAGGLDESFLESPLSTYGFNMSNGAFSVADDFTVSGSTWNVGSMEFYGYQTNSGNTSTITGFYLQIWNGDPSVTGSTVVWGDMTTNRLSSTSFSNIYRADVHLNTARPVMKIIANTTGLSLTPGNYWVQFSAAGSASYTGPWAPPITINGTPTTGNGMVWNGTAWSTLYGYDDGLGTTLYPQGLPFIIKGLKPGNVLWTPASELFTNPEATAAYTGTPETTVWAKPAATKTYTATVTSFEGCAKTQDVTVTVTPGTKAFTLHVLLEGLTKPRDLGEGPVPPPVGTMYEANDENILPKWGTGVADTITVEFFDATFVLAKRFLAVQLLTDASASITVPSAFSGSYWIRVSTRNHVAIWSGTTVSFATSTVDYDFTNDETKAFKNSGDAGVTPVKSIGSGKFAMWAGSMQNDTEEVQFIDTDDATAIVPYVINGDVGYLVPDMDGAGWVDIDDAVYIDVNVPPGVYEQRPMD